MSGLLARFATWLRVRRIAGRALPLLVAALALVWRPAAAQDLELDPGAPTGGAAFANSRWAMLLPDRDPVDACVGGFWTFHFHPSGYFVYSNKTRGVWRVDERGNIRLRTRDGVTLSLLVSGTTLRPGQTVSFVKRSNIFQRCPE